uniref:Transposase Tc1-like domain-containing protein n=1 Tax=Gadus morhua TaxID=8049 RepID=A0A8C5FPN4_GADMO
MPRLTDLDRALAIGQLQAGVPQKNQVAALFGVRPSTLSKLKAKYHITGDVKDRSRSGRPKKTTPQEDHFITLSALRCRRLSSTDLQSRFTIRNRLHAANLRSHRAARSPAMTALHRQARLRWCRQHVHWNLNMWRNVMFRYEVKVWRRRGERYADCCNDKITSFSGGSVMVWGDNLPHWKTRLVIIGGNLNAERYRDEILQPVAIPYVRREWK